MLGFFIRIPNRGNRPHTNSSGEPIISTSDAVGGKCFKDPVEWAIVHDGDGETVHRNVESTKYFFEHSQYYEYRGYQRINDIVYHHFIFISHV